MSNKPSPTAVICLSNGKGGMELDSLKLADLLSNSCNIVLICKKDSFIKQTYNSGNYPFPCETINFLNKNLSLSMFLKARKTLNSYKIRNVIYFGASELKTLFFSFVWKDLNVIVRHGTTKNRTKRSWFHRIVYSCVRHHIAISRHLLENVRKIVPNNTKVNFKIIYPSFLFPEYKNRIADRRQKTRIIHIGRVAPGKGHRDAILACNALYHSEIEFELFFFGAINNDIYTDELMSIMKNLPYKNNIQFCGHVEDVGQYLKNADIFLYPSYGEGFGNVFVESIGHGLSTVTYDNTTFPEFMQMGLKFRMAENRNIDSLSEKLLQAAINIQTDRIQFSTNIILVAELFSKDREIQDWCSILQ